MTPRVTSNSEGDLETCHKLDDTSIPNHTLKKDISLTQMNNSISKCRFINKANYNINVKEYKA